MIIDFDEFQKAQVNKELTAYCERRIPSEHRDQIRLFHKITGNKVILYESRPYFKDPSAKWTEMKIAQFEFDPADKTWELACFDRNGKRREYDLEPKKNLKELLVEVDEDPTGIFWG